MGKDQTGVLRNESPVAANENLDACNKRMYCVPMLQPGNEMLQFPAVGIYWTDEEGRSQRTFAFAESDTFAVQSSEKCFLDLF